MSRRFRGRGVPLVREGVSTSPLPQPTRPRAPRPFRCSRPTLPLATDIARVVVLPGPTKLVLMILASHACNLCGLCWPGMKTLTQECGLGQTRIREALDELVSGDLIAVHAYPKGGRGRATEYVVLPKHMELSTAPCGKCRENQEKPPRGEGFDESGTQKPTARRGVSAKPTGKTPRTGEDQLSVLNLNPQEQHADPQASPSGGATPLDVRATPTSAPEALAKVREMTQGISPKPAPDLVPRPKGDPSTAETAR